MTKGQLVNLAGAFNTFDYAVPKQWSNSVAGLGIEPQDYVWDYAHGDGQPKNLLSFVVEDIKKGNLIPAECLDNIIQLAKEGKTTKEIRELVQAFCAGY